MKAMVVGGGAFGSWTALWLRRRGHDVLLLDACRPGNSLASSGDEARVTRSGHAGDDFYPRWQRRSLDHWRGIDEALFVRTGMLWLAAGERGPHRALVDPGVPRTTGARLPNAREATLPAAVRPPG